MQEAPGAWLANASRSQGASRELGNGGRRFPVSGASAEDFRLDAGEGHFYRNRSDALLHRYEQRPYTLP